MTRSRLTSDRLDELYAGALALVAEHGFDRLTMDQIAEATRSSKATLYRQWGGKAQLLAQALRCSTATSDAVADTGSLRGDLAELVQHRSRSLDQEADLIGSILHAMKADEALRSAVRDEVVSAHRAQLDTVLQRAVARGEVAADNPALEHIDLVVIAPFVLRVLIDDEPVDDAYLSAYLDAVVLPALGMASP